jgi:hypothetical protein
MTSAATTTPNRQAPCQPAGPVSLDRPRDRPLSPDIQQLATRLETVDWANKVLPTQERDAFIF